MCFWGNVKYQKFSFVKFLLSRHMVLIALQSGPFIGYWINDPKVFNRPTICFLENEFFAVICPMPIDVFTVIFFFFYIFIVFTSITPTITKVLLSVCGPLVFYYSRIFLIFNCFQEVFLVHPVEVILLRKQYYWWIWGNIGPFFIVFFILLFVTNDLESVPSKGVL